MLNKQAPRILFFGMEGQFSSLVLQSLLASDIRVCAVVMPTTLNTSPIQRRERMRTPRLLPLLNSHLRASITQLAWEHDIPLWEVYSLTSTETISTLAAYDTDCICVACFSKRIPQAILQLPRLGCLNAHPSLLPANRGPDPLFWAFREGTQQTGITIHLMDEGMDTGAILAQESFQLPDGITYSQLERDCGVRGGRLLVQSIWGIYEQKISPVPQDEQKSSSYSFPTEEDVVVPVAEWDAQRVYNFIRGVIDTHGPVILSLDGRDIPVQQAISYSHSDIAEEPLDEDGVQIVRCKGGWVKVELSE